MNNKVFKKILYTPLNNNMTYTWNFGSLLGFLLFFQIMMGILLSMHYVGHVNYAFSSVQHIMSNVNGGWLLHGLHTNIASAFFVCMYVHIAKGMYYGSYLLKAPVWVFGMFIFMLSMLTAFMGYVLPWGQMSYWGCTVITNFMTAIPQMGQNIVEWVWGGYTVGQPTLNSFFALHFLFPFLILIFVILHMYFLHMVGSSNTIGVPVGGNSVSFNPFFVWKDIYGLLMMLAMLLYFVFFSPYYFGEAENWISANSLVTPAHMMPEWYFLFAYSMLSSIPSKMQGVLALLGSMVMLFSLHIMHKSKVKTLYFKPFSQFIFWVFISNFMLLTILGSKPTSHPYTQLGILGFMLYFSFFLLSPFHRS